MNTNLGLIGKKLGNTQLFNEEGNVQRVTVISCGPCVVLGKRTEEKDGYTALILGYGDKSDKGVNKPAAGFFKKINQTAKRTIKELRMNADNLAKYEVGQSLKPSEIFTVGQKVDVSGTSRGRGFTGVMTRWNFAGFGRSHGTHEYRRHGGSIGTNMTPGRTLPNLKMPGQSGNVPSTMQNLKVARIMDEEQLILIEGAVPGAKNNMVTVRHAIKAKTAKST
ncbi:MAG: 50S ribosomal protein L3 [Sandaracinaceae bacterium]|nr:50S ribosomal protein L3 [Sandaracinaceae bacterium]